MSKAGFIIVPISVLFFILNTVYLSYQEEIFLKNINFSISKAAFTRTTFRRAIF